MFAKRVLVLMLALGLVAFVAGCGGKKAVQQPEVTTPEPTPTTPPPVEEPVTKPAPQPKEVAAPVVNDVFFAFDKYNLTAESKGILEADAQELKRADNYSITIEGHCDERGTESYNLALGEKRANAAKDYLISLGVNASRINTISYGEERPFDPGHNEAAWAKNRRAHFVVQK